MATFHFRLATLLKLRENERGQRQLEAAQAQEAERILQRQAGDLGGEIDQLKSKVRAATAPGEVPIDALLEMQRYTLQLKSHAMFVAQQIVTVRAEVERRRKTLLDADRQVRTLEKLRDHQAAAFEKHAVLQEQKMFDEIAQQRFIQDRRASYE